MCKLGSDTWKTSGDRLKSNGACRMYLSKIICMIQYKMEEIIKIQIKTFWLQSLELDESIERSIFYGRQLVRLVYDTKNQYTVVNQNARIA